MERHETTQPDPQTASDAARAAATLRSGRRCLVTVGATAGFRPLLAAVLDRGFVAGLKARGFTELLVQTGATDVVWAQTVLDATRLEAADEKDHDHTLTIQLTAYATDLGALMSVCRGGPTSVFPHAAIAAMSPAVMTAAQYAPGVVVAHAGAGSILDAARLDVPLVVVPNAALLGNHQAELADAVSAAGWAVRADVGRSSHHQDVDRLLAAVDAVLGTATAPDPTATPWYEQPPPPFPTVEAERSGLFDWAALYAGAPETATATEGCLLQLDG